MSDREANCILGDKDAKSQGTKRNREVESPSWFIRLLLASFSWKNRRSKKKRKSLLKGNKKV